MEWMYKDKNEVDPEEYLLGRKIDSNFTKEEAPLENYMLSIRNQDASFQGQSDLSRKIVEDPLTKIKEQEFERKKLLVKQALLRQSHSIQNNTTLIMSPKPAKSLESMIIKNLKKIPYNIDIEKLHYSLKEKKDRKRRKNSRRETSDKVDRKSNSKCRSSCFRRRRDSKSRS